MRCLFIYSRTRFQICPFNLLDLEPHPAISRQTAPMTSTWQQNVFRPVSVAIWYAETLIEFVSQVATFESGTCILSISQTMCRILFFIILSDPRTSCNLLAAWSCNEMNGRVSTSNTTLILTTYFPHPCLFAFNLLTWNAVATHFTPWPSSITTGVSKAI